MVVVADAKSMSPNMFITSLANGSHVVYLSLNDQEEQFSLISSFIPLNNLGRKNIGYLYAIQHGAEYMWDFDDANIGLIALNKMKIESKTPCGKFTCKTTNPYPYFCVNDTSWPRGLPLQDVIGSHMIPKMCPIIKQNTKIAIYQSLANFQPDVDAVFRLTHKTPVFC